MSAEFELADRGTEEHARMRTDTRALDPKLHLLRRVSLFEELDDDALRALAAGATLKSYGKGATIVRKDDSSRALLVVAAGRVEAVLDPLGASPVRLCEFGRGDYFGEMSLLDGAPRSATAIALEPSEILEIDGEAVLAQITTPISRKLLRGLAARVRRTDATVTELADKVYRAAYANVHAAVRVELDTIKTLYQRTEELSQRTLEQAERRGEETLGNANRVVDRVQQRIDSAMALLTKRIAPVLSILTVVLGGLGIHSYLDVRDKYREAVGWHDSLGKFQERVRSADKSLRVISETMTDLRARVKPRVWTRRSRRRLSCAGRRSSSSGRRVSSTRSTSRRRARARATSSSIRRWCSRPPARSSISRRGAGWMGSLRSAVASVRSCWRHYHS